MDVRGQTSFDYLLLIAGVILLVLIIGYYILSGAIFIHQELNDVDTDIFGRK